MTLNHMSRMQMIVGVWCVIALAMVFGSAVLGTAWSTSVLVLIVVAVPLAITAMLALATPPLTVGELLHSIDATTRRG